MARFASVVKATVDEAAQTAGARRSMATTDLVESALVAVRDVVARLGLGRPDDARLLVRSRRICVHLVDLGLVARARVDDGVFEAEALLREISVVQHLAVRGAPVTPPATYFLAGPHQANGFVLSLWPYVEHVPLDADEPAGVEAARVALGRVHVALADYPHPLPSWRMDRIAKCGALLADISVLPALPGPDRHFLLEAYDSLIRQLDRHEIEAVPVHGDAHPANVFVTRDGPIWSDFDAVCVGPRAWDFGTLGVHPRGESDDVAELLALVRSLCVSTWCWDLADIPEKREAAVYHLDYLKTRLFSGGSL